MATITELAFSPVKNLLEYLNARPSGSTLRRADVETRAVAVFNGNGDVVPDEVGLLPDNSEVLREHENTRGERGNYITTWKFVHAVDLVEQVKNTCLQMDRRTCKQIHAVYRELEDSTIDMDRMKTSIKPKLKPRLTFHGKPPRVAADPAKVEEVDQPRPMDPSMAAQITAIVAETLKALRILPSVPSTPAPAK